jgi:hypothetical protein
MIPLGRTGFGRDEIYPDIIDVMDFVDIPTLDLGYPSLSSIIKYLTGHIFTKIPSN